MFGILRKLQFFAAVALCLGFAGAAHAHTTALTPKITTGLTWAKLGFVTKLPTTVAVFTSVDASYARVTLDRPYKKSHNITIKLAPAHTYHLRVTATPKKGQPYRYVGSISTGAPGSMLASLRAGNSGFLLNGGPFVPRVAFVYGCTGAESFVESIKDALNIGSNVIEGADICANIPMDERKNLFQQELTGKLWLHETDPINASQLIETNTLMNWSAAEMPVSSGPKGWADDTYFRAFGCKSTTQLYENARVTQGVTTYTMSLARYAIRQGLSTCVTPQTLAAEFWTAVLARVKGFRYTTVDAGSQGTYDVTSELAAEAVLLSNRLDSLEPALLSGRWATLVSSSSYVKSAAITYGGATYVIAVNTTSSSQKSSFAIPKGAGLKFTRLWEGGLIKRTMSRISENFGPLAVHIYRGLPIAKK